MNTANKTKVEAIRLAIKARGGIATLHAIYQDVKKYKTDVDVAKDWKAGLRGVLYREIRNGRQFRKVGAGKYGLI